MNCESEVIDWHCEFSREKTPFSAGIPFIGFQCKVLRHARKILNYRNVENALDRWIGEGYDAYSVSIFCDRIFHLTVEWARWPNHYFFPDDNARVLLCNIPGLDVELSDVIIPLFKMYGVDWGGKDDASWRILDKICCDVGIKMSALLSFFLCCRE